MVFCYCLQPLNSPRSRLHLGAFWGEKLVGEEEVGKGDGGTEISLPPSFSSHFFSPRFLESHPLTHLFWIKAAASRNSAEWGGNSSQTPSQGHLWPLHPQATSAMDDLGVMEPTSLPHREPFPTPGQSLCSTERLQLPFRTRV